MPDIWRGVAEHAAQVKQELNADEWPPRTHVALCLLEIQENSPQWFRRLAQLFVSGKPTDSTVVNALFEHLRSPDVVPPGKKTPVGGALHPELQMLRDALEEEGGG
jgi:hypothetical protein